MFDLVGYRPGHSRERVVPDGRMYLIIELDGRGRSIYDRLTGEPIQACQQAWLSGIHQQHFVIGDLSAESRLLAICFAPGASAQFTHEPAHTFCERIVQAEEVFGAPILSLRDQLLKLPDPMQRLTHTEAWLADRLDESFQTPPYVQVALDELLSRPGNMRLTEFVARRAEVSYKHFVEVFQRQVGPGPKVMQRILRFASVFTRLQGQARVNWAELSQDLGFSDQAHFIREFVAFSGYRPSEFQAQFNDRENFFPEDGARSTPDG